MFWLTTCNAPLPKQNIGVCYSPGECETGKEQIRDKLACLKLPCEREGCVFLACITE